MGMNSAAGYFSFKYLNKENITYKIDNHHLNFFAEIATKFFLSIRGIYRLSNCFAKLLFTAVSFDSYMGYRQGDLKFYDFFLSLFGSGFFSRVKSC